jgi:hypothetical protein
MKMLNDSVRRLRPNHAEQTVSQHDKDEGLHLTGGVDKASAIG